MQMKAKKRKLRTYKTFDPIYNSAMKKAEKYDIKLCRAIELFLTSLSKSKSATITVNLTEK